METATLLLSSNSSNVVNSTSQASISNEIQLELEKIDKAIRSSNIGEQCEGIILSSKLLLLPQVPNVVINTLILKLADIFRTSNNFIRYQIFGIIRNCESQMSKILTLPEVLRRIGSVLQSNDPVARAITLRTLGSIPLIIVDQLNIHHGIRNCLDSHHQLEIDASIFAIDQLSSKSSIFATGIINKLAYMIEGIETSLSTKIKLIRIFRHMHYTPEVAQQARKICINLLQIYPTRGFFLTILDTLTCLSEKSLLDIPEQIQLLLDTFYKDPRETVKLLTLNNLNRLAKIFSHQNFHIAELFDVLNSKSSKLSIQCGILQILETLSFYSNQEFNNNEETILKICEAFVFSENISAIKRSSQIFCNIYLKNKGKDYKTSNQISMATRFISNLCSSLSSTLLENPVSSNQLNQISSLLKIIQNFIKIDENITAPIFFETVISLLPQLEASVAELICLALPSFVVLNRRAILPFISPLVLFLNESLQSNFSNITLAVSICKVLVISYESNTTQRNSSVEQMGPILQKLNSGAQPYLQFRLAKILFCYGLQNLTISLWKNLSTQVESEFFVSWFQALQSISQAETDLLTSIHNLPNSIRLLYAAQTFLSASVTPLSNLHFQLKFLQFRISFLEQILSLRNLLQVSCSIGELNYTFKEFLTIYSMLSKETPNQLKPQTKVCFQDHQIVCLLISFSIKILIAEESSTNLKKQDVSPHPDLLVLKDCPTHNCTSLFATCRAFYQILMESSTPKKKAIHFFLEKLLNLSTSYPLDFFIHSH